MCQKLSTIQIICTFGYICDEEVLTSKLNKSQWCSGRFVSVQISKTGKQSLEWTEEGGWQLQPRFRIHSLWCQQLKFYRGYVAFCLSTYRCCSYKWAIFYSILTSFPLRRPILVDLQTAVPWGLWNQVLNSKLNVDTGVKSIVSCWSLYIVPKFLNHPWCNQTQQIGLNWKKC